MTTSFGGSSQNSGGPVVVASSRLITFAVASGVASKASLSAPNSGAQAFKNGQPTRYKFRINPDRLQTRHDKLEKYILTKAAYERQYWGNGLTVFSFSGSSGVFKPDLTVQEFLNRFPSGSFDIRKTNAWLRFQEFETFYRKTGSTNIFMYYDAYDHEWEGSLSGFSFDRTAAMPFHITYQFTFTALPIDYPSTTLQTGVAAADGPAVRAQQASGGFEGDYTIPPGPRAPSNELAQTRRPLQG